MLVNICVYKHVLEGNLSPGTWRDTKTGTNIKTFSLLIRFYWCFVAM